MIGRLVIVAALVLAVGQPMWSAAVEVRRDVRARRAARE
jgi:hypothetical protein